MILPPQNLIHQNGALKLKATEEEIMSCNIILAEKIQ